MTQNEIIKKLKTEREKRKITQEQMSEIVGCNRSKYIAFEGETREMKGSFISAVANELGFSYENKLKKLQKKS